MVRPTDWPGSSGDSGSPGNPDGPSGGGNSEGGDGGGSHWSEEFPGWRGYSPWRDRSERMAILDRAGAVVPLQFDEELNVIPPTPVYPAREERIRTGMPNFRWVDKSVRGTYMLIILTRLEPDSSPEAEASYDGLVGESFQLPEEHELPPGRYRWELGSAQPFLGGYFHEPTEFVVLHQADLNGDEAVDVLDYSAFMSAYAIEDALADFDQNGTIDFLDLLDFIAAYRGG
ncbi:MAG: hypothetical protein SFZ23_11595 [Planctomycetota bacterium]|nr:hypothetical protein [Planctomycetota bacterium]